MTNSPNYTDHLIAALRCLDNENLRLLSKEIKSRIPKKCKACKGDGWFAFYGTREECQQCNGSGELNSNDLFEKMKSPSNATTGSAISDTERLDWMQSTNETVWRVSHDERRPITDGTNGTELVSVFEGWTVDDPDNPKPTIREAIDHFIHSQNAKDQERNASPASDCSK